MYNKREVKKRKNMKKKIFEYLILAQSSLVVVGSLYYEYFGDPIKNGGRGDFFPSGGGYNPCYYCWFGRILMYPILILVIVALIRKDKNYPYYILPFSFLAFLLEIYHYILQMIPNSVITPCSSVGISCSTPYVQYFGFITIPFLGILAMAFITILCVLQIRKNKNNS